MLAKIPVEGNIVKDYYIGNTHIIFSDAAYTKNSAADNQRILDAAAQASLNIIIRNQNPQEKGADS